MDQAAQKNLLRKQLHDQRSQLSADFCTHAAQGLALGLKQLANLQKVHHIAWYWPIRNECSCIPFIEQLPKSVFSYLPVIEIETRMMKFYPYYSDEDLQFNLFKIPEPITHNKQPIETQELDWVIIPLLGFDESGNRLGMGGGYYDQSLAFLLNRAEPKQKPLLIGLAYEFQKLAQIPHEAWDLRLDYVICEEKIYQCSSAKFFEITPDN